MLTMLGLQVTEVRPRLGATVIPGVHPHGMDFRHCVAVELRLW